MHNKNGSLTIWVVILFEIELCPKPIRFSKPYRFIISELYLFFTPKIKRNNFTTRIVKEPLFFTKMRHIQKPKNSEVLQQNLTYKKGRDNRKLREILVKEQGGFCAYTDKHFKSETPNIDHFKPQKLLQTGEDGYHNWFAIYYTTNVVEKRAQWKEPILHPTDPTITERIWYKEDETNNTIIVSYAPEDEAAENFVQITGLNRNILAEERAAFVGRLRLLKRILKMEEIKRHFLVYPPEIDFYRLTEWELGIIL